MCTQTTPQITLTLLKSHKLEFDKTSSSTDVKSKSTDVDNTILMLLVPVLMIL